jgi:FtsP/CotA-like multicopper oxidase with cupredoxin domain
MNRRRFVVSSISAAAVGSALATDACSSSGGGVGPIPPPPPGPVNVLNVEYAVTDIAGYKLRTRTYNGRTVGPMLVTRPGDTLRVRVVNRLPRTAHAAVPTGRTRVPIDSEMEAMDATAHSGRYEWSQHIDLMNNPHGFNDTNLHVHGLQTVPHLFQPLGTSDVMAPMIAIKPGQSYLYEFPIPPDHPSGLHWYHPHKHGSTDVQVSGGMAGTIVVRGPIDEVPEIAAAREIFLVVQSLGVNPSKTHRGIYEREYIPYRDKANGGYSFGTQYAMYTVNGRGIYWADFTKNPSAFTPLGVPRYYLQPGEVVRLRLLNGCNGTPLMLALPGFDAWQIGFDGVNLLEPAYIDMSGSPLITPANMFDSPIRLTMEANRIEFLLRAPKKEGTYTLKSSPSKGVDFSAFPELNLAEFVVAGRPVRMRIPRSLPKPTREYPVIKDSDIVAKRKFVFNQGNGDQIPAVKGLLTGFGFVINDQLYQEMECPSRPRVGTCEEWRLENAAADEAHPFHLHENSFQLIAINDKPNDPMEVWDTFAIPPKQNGVNGSITIRVRFVQWHGKTVFHCHILPHEDTGMMQNILMV